MMAMDLVEFLVFVPEHAFRAIHALLLVKECPTLIVLEANTIIQYGGLGQLFLTMGKLASVLVVALSRLNPVPAQLGLVVAVGVAGIPSTLDVGVLLGLRLLGIEVVLGGALLLLLLSRVEWAGVGGSAEGSTRLELPGAGGEWIACMLASLLRAAIEVAGRHRSQEVLDIARAGIVFMLQLRLTQNILVNLVAVIMRKVRLLILGLPIVLRDILTTSESPISSHLRALGITLNRIVVAMGVENLGHLWSLLLVTRGRLISRLACYLFLSLMPQN